MVFTLTGQVTLPSGAPFVGFAQVTPLEPVRDTAGHVVRTGAESQTLDSAGSFTFTNLPDDTLATGYTIAVYPTMPKAALIPPTEFAAGAPGSTVYLDAILAAAGTSVPALLNDLDIAVAGVLGYGGATDTALAATYVGNPTPTPPANPQVGQVWYSSALRHLRVPTHLAERQAVFTQTGSWEGQTLQEASVWAANNKLNALFTAGSGLGFASCPLTADPTKPGNWSRPATYTGPVVSGAKHASTFIENGTIHLYYIDQATSAKVMHATASTADAVPVFSAGTQVMSLPATASVFGNTRVVRDDNGTLYLYIEYKVSSTQRWQIGVATTPGNALDGTWTLITGMEILDTLWPDVDHQTACGPWLAKENGEWVMYYHSSVNWNGLLPSEVYRATAPTLGTNNWTVTDASEPIIRRRAPWEVDQTADVEVVRAPDGTAYAFWTGMQNRGAQFTGKIACAALRPTHMRWTGSQWIPADGRLDPGFSYAEARKPRTVPLASDVSIVGQDNVWQDFPGLSQTYMVKGPDIEVELRGIMAPTGSSGYIYEFQAVIGSTTVKMGGIRGTVGVPTAVIAVGKFTQLTPGFKSVKIQARVAAAAGTLYCRPVGQPIEHAVMKITDVEYP